MADVTTRVKEGLQEARDRATETLHNAWPFRRDTRPGAEPEPVPFPVDIYETDDEFVLVGDLPGVAKDRLNIRITENELVIAGEVRVELPHGETPVIWETNGASYRRSFTLSDAVDREKVKADLKNGVLTVRLAKSERIKPRKIEISA